MVSPTKAQKQKHQFPHLYVVYYLSNYFIYLLFIYSVYLDTNVPNVMEIWEPKPSGTLWATPGLLRDSFTFTSHYFSIYEYLVCATSRVQSIALSARKTNSFLTSARMT